jgi:hypothetical protein
VSKYVEKPRTIQVTMTIELYGNEDQMRRSMRKLESEIELQHYNVSAFGWQEVDE